VQSAALALSLPLEGSQWGSVFVVADKPVPERSKLPGSAFSPVSANFFDAMGMRLVKGRRFTPADSVGAGAVAVVNETFARKMWPSEDPIGKRLKQGWPETPPEKSPWREVVGVVADVKLNGVAQDTPLEVYVPLMQEPSRIVAVIVRTDSDAATI